MNNKSRLLISVLLLVISALFFFMVLTVDVDNIGPNNTEVGLSQLNKLVFVKLGTNMALYDLTDYSGYLAILVVGCFGLLGLVQLIKRKSLLKVDHQVLSLGALYFVIALIYVFFEKVIINYRPVIMPGEVSPEASFPSSHTLLCMVVFISCAMVLKDYIKNKGLAKVLSLVFVLLAILTVVGRLMSGVHWFSDIVASVLFSATLLSFFSLVLEKIREDK